MRNQNVLSLRSRSSAVLFAAICLLGSSGVIVAAEPSDYLSSGAQHRLFTSDLPPGAVGQARLAGRGPVAGYFQPVAFSGPDEVQFALTQNGVFTEPQPSLQAGLLVGAIYRFRVTGIPRAPGAELYPTVEVIDRTYPPPGLATRYPIPIRLDQDDLEAALEGHLVTRVILLEDPQTAAPMEQTPETSMPIDIASHQDALEVADRFGRPVAIVRMGSLSPPRSPALLPQFFLGYPAWVPILPLESKPPIESLPPVEPQSAR